MKRSPLGLQACLALICFSFALVPGCGPSNTEPAVDKLKIVDVKQGTGPGAQRSDTLYVRYTGTLRDGTVFDSNVGGEPFKFLLGAGKVIQGWDEGLLGMKAGGVRKLAIPAELAYGKSSPSPKIPANSQLHFEIELLKIE